MSQPNRQQRRAVAKKSPQAPSIPPQAAPPAEPSIPGYNPVPISDEADRALIIEANKKATDVKVKLGAQQRLIARLIIQRDQVQLAGTNEALGVAQLDLMVAEQLRTEMAQAALNAQEELRKIGHEVAKKCGLEIDGSAGQYTIDLTRMVISRVG